MVDELMSFAKIKPNTSLIEEIWAFDVNNLDKVADTTISKYVVALAQWLVFYKYQVNKIKSSINKLQSDLEFLISAWISKAIIKEYGTKTAARDYLIRSNPESSLMENKLNELKDDLVKMEGIDKAVSELIAAFKRELTRRDNELYAIRRERKL
jgi:hypothetical protein